MGNKRAKGFGHSHGYFSSLKLRLVPGHELLSFLFRFTHKNLSTLDPVSTVASDMSPTRSKARKQSSLLAIKQNTAWWLCFVLYLGFGHAYGHFVSLRSQSGSCARPGQSWPKGTPRLSFESLRSRRYITKDSPFGLSFVYLRERRDSNPRPLP